MEHALISPQSERLLMANRGPFHRAYASLITGLRQAFHPQTAQPERYIIRLTIVLMLLSVVFFPAGARTDTEICGYPVDGQVRIHREGETHATFAVSLAESTFRHRRGLMHCPHLPTGHGMLFIYDTARPRAFWMKDTPLALAIIFIADDGRIAAIAKGIPQSLNRIPSPGPVRYVLEINQTEAQGLRRGDQMQWNRVSAPPNN